MHGFDKILCKTDLFPIQRLTHMSDTFQNENFEAFVSPSVCLCGIHDFDNMCFAKVKLHTVLIKILKDHRNLLEL